MDAVNSSFYFITDKMIELQAFFLRVANSIAYVVLLIAVLTAAVNYALTGTGLKENIIKIGKAFVFFSIVIFAYPNIVGWITDLTFSMARDSTYTGMTEYLRSTASEIENIAMEKEGDDEAWTYGTMAVRKYDNFFKGIINNRTFTTYTGKSFKYSTVAPAAALRSVLLVAGECFRFTERFSLNNPGKSIASVIKGTGCALFVLITGIFCILEYLIAFIEFMFVSSVGVILFPLSLWEGTKFMAEKYIGAMLGFFLSFFSALSAFSLCCTLSFHCRICIRKNLSQARLSRLQLSFFLLC
jgi:hypothetical protein